MREPKIQKLKGGNTFSAQLFITGWIKEVCVVIRDHTLTDEEGGPVDPRIHRIKSETTSRLLPRHDSQSNHRRCSRPFNIRVLFGRGRVHYQK